MADAVNVKINQTIKGNKFSGNSKIIQKGRIRFTLPANIIINLRARQKVKAKEKSNIKATQSLQIKEAGGSDDER